jgi:hypothetical protein
MSPSALLRPLAVEEPAPPRLAAGERETGELATALPFTFSGPGIGVPLVPDLGDDPRARSRVRITSLG